VEKKNNTFILSALIVMIAAATLTACGGSGTTETPPVSDNNNNERDTPYIIHPDPANKGASDVLAEDSYTNYAWGHQYNGAMICADGSIYLFDKSNDDIAVNVNSAQEMNEYSLNNAELSDIRVSDDDLQEILEYISQIDPDKHSEEKNTANDAGSHNIQVYDYTADSKISLKETGDWESKNTSPNADKLVKLITKYTDKARTENAQKQG
jgi:predicted small lipoprotein YifL